MSARAEERPPGEAASESAPRALLSPSLAQQISALTPGQIVALRFAADEELEELVSAVTAGKFVKTKELKQAIKNWRADHFRV